MQHRPYHALIRTAQAGFTLVEMAVVVLIIGLLLTASLAVLRPYLESTQRKATAEKLHNIGDALANFAQVHGRLPCPASPNPVNQPFGAPLGSGPTGLNVNDPCGSAVPGAALGNFVGIVPFRALGLGEDTARDGYGRLITYAASPMVTDGDVGSDTNQIHIQCLQATWIDTGLTPPNRNRNKAQLCCPGPRTLGTPSTLNDLIVNDANGVSAFSGQHSTDRNNYANITTTTTGLPVANTDNAVVAFILISHGMNGNGAYLSGQNGQQPNSGVISANETENSDGDRTFIDRPMDRGDANYFDDVVYWRTNHQLVSAFGNDSCARP